MAKNDHKSALKSLQQISSNLTINNFSYLIFFKKLFETSPKRPGETLAGSCVQIATAVRPISNVSTSWSIIVIVPQTRGAVSRVCGKGAMQGKYIPKIRILHHFRFALNNLAVYTKKYISSDHGQSFLKPCLPQAKVSQIMLIKRNKFPRMWTPTAPCTFPPAAMLQLFWGKVAIRWWTISPSHLSRSAPPS